MDATVAITTFHQGHRDDIADKLAVMSFTMLDDAIQEVIRVKEVLKTSHFFCPYMELGRSRHLLCRPVHLPLWVLLTKLVQYYMCMDFGHADNLLDNIEFCGEIHVEHSNEEDDLAKPIDMMMSIPLALDDWLRDILFHMVIESWGCMLLLKLPIQLHPKPYYVEGFE